VAPTDVDGVLSTPDPGSSSEEGVPADAAGGMCGGGGEGSAFQNRRCRPPPLRVLLPMDTPITDHPVLFFFIPRNTFF
jgi:hypothetical protein